MGATEGDLSRAEPRLTVGRLLIRPYASAGSPREPLIAGICISVIVGIYILEVITPDDYVVIDLSLLPLLVAIWVLSPRMTAVVGIVAAVLYIDELVIDTANRMTVILIGATMLVTVVVARLYATNLAFLLASRRHLRPTLPTRATAPTLEAIDRSAHGVRSLTRRELAVARLAAQGYTSREIGSQLRIGSRTVETHLASAYAKLRIRSRAQLIRMAGQLGVPS